MTGVLHRNTGATFTLPNMPSVNSFIDGFIADDIVDLHLFDGADTTANISNRVPSKPATAMIAQTGSGALMTNGGIRIQAAAYVPEAQDIDITLPFTAMWHGSIDIPVAGGTQWNQAVLSTEQYTNRGFIMYAFANNTYPVDTTQIALNGRNSVNAAQAAANALPLSAQLTYNDKRTFVVRSDGTTLEFIVINNGIIITNVAYNPDYTGMTTASSVQDKTMKLTCGTLSVVYATGIMSIEGFVTYNAKKTNTALFTNDARFIQKRQARGR